MAQFFGLIPLNAANFESGAAASGQVLTADGAGGASFEDAAGGGMTSEYPVAGALLVTGAGISDANGFYHDSGVLWNDVRPLYIKAGEAEYPRIRWQGGNWAILLSEWPAVYYSFDDVATPDLCTVWDNDDGEFPLSVVPAANYPPTFLLGADGAGGAAWQEPAAAWNINVSGGRELPGATASGGVGAVAEGAATASGAYSHAMGTSGAEARFTGSYAASSGASPLTNQYGRYLHHGATNSADRAEIFIGDDERLLVPSGQCYAFRTLVSAYNLEANKAAGYELRGVIKNYWGTLSLVGTVSKTVLAEDDASWDVEMEADALNGALAIFVTGNATGATHWHAVTEVSEVMSTAPW